MFRKGKNAVEGDFKKSWSGIETEIELNKRRWGWRLAWWESIDKKEASHLLGLRRRHQRFNRIKAPCIASTAVGTEGKEDQMARLSA